MDKVYRSYLCSRYVIEAGGIQSEISYPYNATDGSCKFDNTKIAAKIKSYEYSEPKGDEDALVKTVAEIGPVSTSINATGIKHYKSGVYDGEGCSNTEHSSSHSVLIVGYSPDYWIIKNSWGVDWGEDGYIRFARGLNVCGLAWKPAYPIA